MDETVNAILRGNQAIRKAVTGRIAPLKRDDKYPAITFERNDTGRQRTAGGKAISTRRSDYSVVVRAKTVTTCSEIATLCEAHLDGLRGNYAGQKVMLTQVNSVSDAQLLEPDITEITLDVSFTHRAINP